MKLGEAIKEAIILKGMRFVDVAGKVGIATNTLGNRLNGDRNISLDKADEILHAIGYKMMIVPEDVEEKPGWYNLDSRKYANEKNAKDEGENNNE